MPNAIVEANEHTKPQHKTHRRTRAKTSEFLEERLGLKFEITGQSPLKRSYTQQAAPEPSFRMTTVGKG